MKAALGATLLRRTTRSLVLTPEGAGYLERCRRALEELEEAARALRGEDAEPRGVLILTAPVVFGRLHVLPLVSALLRAHPGLEVRLTLTGHVVRLAEEGIDAAVRIAQLPDSVLHAVRRVLVASPGYLATHGVPARVTELHRHALIGFPARLEAACGQALRVAAVMEGFARIATPITFRGQADFAAFQAAELEKYRAVRWKPGGRRPGVEWGRAVSFARAAACRGSASRQKATSGRC